MINLEKNQGVNLAKEGSTLFECIVKWTLSPMTGKGADVDIVALRCDARKKIMVPDSQNVIFYNNPKSTDNAIVHSGDERSGGQESIVIDFSKMDADVDTIPIAISLHDKNGENLTFGDVTSLSVEIIDITLGKKVAAYYPEFENGADNLMVAGEFEYKGAGLAFFKALGQVSKEGLGKFLVSYGAEVKGM